MAGANYGQELMSWQIPEFIKHERGKRWYVFFIVIVAVLLFLCFKTPNFIFPSTNFLFAVIIILAAVIILTDNAREPEMVDFIIGTEGIVIDNTFFDYDDFNHFSIVFKPIEEIEVLYLTHNNVIRPRHSIDLEGNNPIEVRNILGRYMKEDLDRTDQSNTDFFSRILKI